MADIDVPPRLVCFEYRGRLNGGASHPLIVAAQDDDGNEREMVMKVRHPSVAPQVTHYGPTSLALELVCAMLARAVGLNVPDYAILEVPRDLPSAIEDEQVRQLLQANVGDNFGCLYLEQMATWRPPVMPIRSEEVLDSVEEVITFDVAIVNGDRTPMNPNILTDGVAAFWLIDHSIALPAHRWTEEVRATGPILADEEIRDHCAYDGLRGKGRPYASLLGRWGDAVRDADLDLIRDSVPSSWETRAGDLDAIFEVLSRRPGRFSAITGALQRVVS